jgi:16S rRNA processing protein RimM
MQQADYIHIGKIVAVFGLKGELILQHALGKKTQFKPQEVVFIEEIKGSYLPYFVLGSRAKSIYETILQLEAVATPEAAARLRGKPVWITETDFRQLAGNKAPISLLGYMVINQGESLGPVEEVIEQPHQVLLTIRSHGKEVYIPLHEESLLSIRHDKKEIVVQLPDGLLDIYL